MVYLALLIKRISNNWLLITSGCIVFFGCATLSVNQQKEIPREIVMSDGMEICAADNNDYICVIAVGNTKRTIKWDGEEHSINLIPRKKRWHGNLGLITPKPPMNIWSTRKGLMRVLIEECQINYDNVENAVKRLPFYQEDGINVAYNDSGLLIMWRKTVWPDEQLLDLSIFQININGEKPHKLPGSQNDKVVVKGSSY